MAPFYSSVLDHKSPNPAVALPLFLPILAKRNILYQAKIVGSSYIEGLLLTKFLNPFLQSSKFWTFENFEDTQTWYQKKIIFHKVCMYVDQILRFVILLQNQVKAVLNKQNHTTNVSNPSEFKNCYSIYIIYIFE